MRAYTIKENKKISDAELIVMKVIWDRNEPVMCIDVIEDLEKNYGYKYADTTVYTFLKNLINKGFLSFNKEQRRAKVFTPAVTKEEYLKNHLQQELDFWFAGNKKEFTKAIKEL